MGEQLEVWEVIDRAYQKITKKYGVEETLLEPPVRVLVGEWDEFGSIARGYGSCKKASLVEVGENRWLLTQIVDQPVGTGAGANIIAIKVGSYTDLEELARKKLGETKKMYDSLVYEHRFGNIPNGKIDTYNRAMRNILKELDFNGLVYGGSDCPSDPSGGFPARTALPLGKRLKYSPDMVDVLVDAMEKALSQ